MKKKISILLLLIFIMPIVLFFSSYDIFKDNTTETYKINYVLYGGTNNSLNPTEINDNQNFELMDATREYFDFVGWYTETTYKNKILALKNIKQDIVLYAKWELNNNYFIKECPSYSCVYKENENLICCKGYNLFTKDVSSLQIGDRIVWSRYNDFVLHTIVKIDKENGTFTTSQSQFDDNGDLLPIEMWDESRFDSPLTIDKICGKQIKTLTFEEIVGIKDDVKITNKGLAYIEKNNEINIVKIISDEKIIEIPSTINNKMVTEIGSNITPLTNEKSLIEKIIIPSSVKKLVAYIYNEDLSFEFNNMQTITVKSQITNKIIDNLNLDYFQILYYSTVENLDYNTWKIDKVYKIIEKVKPETYDIKINNKQYASGDTFYIENNSSFTLDVSILNCSKHCDVTYSIKDNEILKNSKTNPNLFETQKSGITTVYIYGLLPSASIKVVVGEINLGIFAISEGECEATATYSLNDSVLPGATITIPLLFKLAQTSESAYYLVGIKDENNILDTAYYFVCGTVTYVIKNDKTYVLSDSADLQVPNTEVSDKFVGKITSGQSIEMIIQTKINEDYTGADQINITCSVCAVQQANLTEQQARTLLLEYFANES